MCSDLTASQQFIKPANKKLIPVVVICACAYDPEIKDYNKKRVSEGKNKMSTPNVIRNKLVARMFAMVNSGTDYVDLMKYAAYYFSS